MLDFESTLKQVVKIRFEISTACEILSQSSYQLSDSEPKTSKTFRFWKKNCFWKIKTIWNARIIRYFLWSFFNVKKLKFSIFTPFRKNWLWNRCFLGKTSFESKLLKRISFRINFCTTHQFSNSEFLNKSDFEPTSYDLSTPESKFSQQVRFWIKLFPPADFPSKLLERVRFWTRKVETC